MSADIALALALEIKELILNVPRNKAGEKLHELNKRCISLLSSLKDPSIDAEDDSSAEFLAEMELVLRGIRGRLKRRKASNYLIAFLQQGEMESWIGAQNQRIEDAFRTMNTRFLIAHASKLTENRARQERDHDEIRRYITDLHTKFRSHFSTEQSSGFDSVGEALSFILHPESLSLPHSTQQASNRPHQQAPHLPPILAPSRFSFEDFLPSPHQISPSDSEASGSRRLPPILAPFDPRSFSLEDFPPSPPHTSPSDSEASRSRRLPPILTPSGFQLEDFPPSPPQISPSDSEASGSRHVPSILAPSRFSLEDFSPSPPQISSSYSESSWSLIERATTSSAQPICKFSKGKISCGNLEGLIDYLIATDDLDSTGVMLDTYLDFATPGEVFEIVKRKVHGVLQKLGHDQKYKIIKLILAWVQTVPDSSVLQTVKDWTLAAESGVTGEHQKMILRAIDGQSRRPNLPIRIVSPEAPVKPQDLAIALTFIESDFQRPIRLLDYLLNSKGLPSRFEALISHHEKLIRWVKRSIMRHDEIQDRAYWIKRLVKTAELCSRLRNYNSMFAIASALNWKLKPVSELPRTMEMLPKDTQTSLKRLTSLVDPDQHYEAYRKMKKADEGDYLPWLRAELDDVKRYLERYPRTIEVDGMTLINFEQYKHLAIKVPRYQAPADIADEERQEPHVAYLREQVERISEDDEADDEHCRRLKKKEEADYQARRPQLRRLGL